jgi:hypothetical protein
LRVESDLKGAVLVDTSRSDVPKQIGSIVPAVFAALLAALAITILPGASARALDDCIDAPNSQPPQGSHWYYRTDRVNERKCWYLGPEGKKVQQVRPTAKSLAPLEAETADDRLPPVQIEQPMTQTRRATTVGDTTQGGASAVQWPDPPQPTGVVARSGAAMSAPALEDHATAAAPDTDAHEKAPAHRPFAAVTELADSATVPPLRMLLLAAGALGAAGILLRAILGIAAVRRRQVFVDQSDADWCTIHSAVGYAVTLIQASSRRANRTMTKT